MNLVLTVAGITAPVALVALIGFLWVRLGYEYRVRFVTQLAMSVAMPCLIFVTLMRTELSASALTAVSAGAVAAYALVIAGTYLATLALRLDRRTYLAPMIFGNTGNLGLPLAFFAFGPDGLGIAVVVFAIMAVINFTFGIWLVSGGSSLRLLVREPILAAALLGGAFMLLGWETPPVLTRTLDLIGQMAIPLMLLTLGVAVAGLHTSNALRAILLSLLKLAICTAAGLLAAWGAGLTGAAQAILVLQVATPVAVTSFMIAEKYGANSQAVAGLVVMSTLLSVLALPAILAVFLG